MATYKNNSTLTNTLFSNSFSTRLGFDTYRIGRTYLRFDTSTITAPLADITGVKLKFNVLGINFNNCNAIIHSAQSGDANWGTALADTVAKFASTFAHLEDTIAITSTGDKEADIDKNNLDLSGTTWFRISNSLEYSGINSNISIGSQNNTTASLRPYLQITYTSGAVQNLLAIMGIG